MRKQEFLAQLRNGLSGLPQDDMEERLAFYSEMIDDRMEEGLSEEAAISEIGNVDEVVAQIVADIPLAKLVKDAIKPKHTLKTWEIILLALGSPVWLSLLLAAFAVILSVYAVIWSVVVSLWAVEASLVVAALGGLAVGIISICHGNGFAGSATIGAGIVCAGLSVFLFFGCREITKGTIFLTQKIALGIKNCFVRKKEAL